MLCLKLHKKRVYLTIGKLHRDCVPFYQNGHVFGSYIFNKFPDMNFTVHISLPSFGPAAWNQEINYFLCGQFIFSL